VAILPFENLSGREYASEKITEYLVLALQSKTELRIPEFGQTYEQMRKFRVRSASLLTDAQIDSLARSLDLAYLVAGTVLEYTQTDDTYLGKIPQVSLNVRLIECASHQTVWAGVVNARGDDHELLFGLGAVRSPEALAQAAVEQAADKIADLFR
jgi:TolB-like protein